MNYIFKGCHNFNQSLDNWPVSLIRNSF